MSIFIVDTWSSEELDDANLEYKQFDSLVDEMKFEYFLKVMEKYSLEDIERLLPEK